VSEHGKRPAAPWLFVHVPKTAGTSLTQAALQAFGEDSCEFDYGVGNPHTTARVAELSHQANDLFRLRKRLAQDQVAMLAGHVPLPRYAPLFPSTRIVSFLREPLAQLLSHHAHINREQAPRPFEEFIRRPQGAGVQARMLTGAPLEALGVIGITERYDDSLRVLNASLGVALQPQQLNQNPQRQDLAQPLYELPPAQASAVDALLRDERQLYARASALLDSRLAMLDAGQPFANGAITECSAQAIAGFAFWAEQHRPVALSIVRNGKPIASLKATIFQARLCMLNVSREGCVGFEHRFATPLQAGERVEVKVAETGQLLGEWHAPGAPA